ncbi:MAG: thioredoxin family protein [Planctomycetes bacterium]|nr:thioredoxin family protein [Planctomycetota bacterium]
MRILLACLLMCAISSPAESGERRPRVLFFHAEWCSPCRKALNGPDSFPEWLRRSGWQVDESIRAHVQLVDVDNRNDLVTIYGVSQIPAMVLIDDVSSAPVLYTGRASLIGMFK